MSRALATDRLLVQIRGHPAPLARRERPHPGAQLSLFETADGWRYSLWALPTTQAGWRNNPVYIDAAHRVPAQVEDRIRTGGDCGIGNFPSESFAINTGRQQRAGSWPSSKRRA